MKSKNINKKICYEDKCITRIGNPPVISKYVGELLEEAIKNGKNSINANEIIFKAEEKAQAEGKISPIVKRNEEYE